MTNLNNLLTALTDDLKRHRQISDDSSISDSLSDYGQGNEQVDEDEYGSDCEEDHDHDEHLSDDSIMTLCSRVYRVRIPSDGYDDSSSGGSDHEPYSPDEYHDCDSDGDGDCD